MALFTNITTAAVVCMLVTYFVLLWNYLQCSQITICGN